MFQIPASEILPCLSDQLSLVDHRIGIAMDYGVGTVHLRDLAYLRCEPPPGVCRAEGAVREIGVVLRYRQLSDPREIVLLRIVLEGA